MVAVQPLIGTSVTITETFSVDGAPIDLDSGVPTIVARYPDGTAVTPAPTASGTWTGRTTGQYRIVLPGEVECTILDPITWTGTIGGQPQTLYSRVEWVGNHLFTIGELRAMKVAGGSTPRFASSTAWPDTQLQAARTAILSEWTRILGFPPVPRFHRKTLNGNAATTISVGGGILVQPRLLSITINGVAQATAGYDFNDASQLEAVTGYGAGTPFTWGRRNIIVEYVHGWPRVEGVGTHMAMMTVAAELDPSVFTSATQVNMPDGSSYTYEPSETGRGGFVRHTGIKAVDKYLNGWAELVPGIA